MLRVKWLDETRYVTAAYRIVYMYTHTHTHIHVYTIERVLKILDLIFDFYLDSNKN